MNKALVCVFAIFLSAGALAQDLTKVSCYITSNKVLDGLSGRHWVVPDAEYTIPYIPNRGRGLFNSNYIDIGFSISKIEDGPSKGQYALALLQSDRGLILAQTLLNQTGNTELQYRALG